MHRADVVLALEALDLEAAVLALTGEAVLEDHHGGHHVVPLEVGDVVALDAQRSRVQAECLRDLLQGPGAGGQVGGPLGLVQAERLLGVALDRRHEVLLVAALRDAQADLGAPALGEPLGDRLGVLGQGGDQDLLGDGVAALLPVQLLEGVFDEAGGVDRLDLVGDPAALAADPAAAHVEDLEGGLQLVLGDGDEVGVGGVGEDDCALLHGPLERLGVVPEPGGALVLHLLGRLHHVLLQAADVGARTPGHEVAEVLGQLPVFLGGDPADAGGRALVDVAQQARAAGAGGVLEDPGGAGADGEDAEHQVDRLADRPGVPVRTEVAHALLLGAAHHLDAGELLVQRDGEVGIALVVPVLDVEPGVELLDPGVLQLERLDLGGDDRPLDGCGGRDHRARTRVEIGQVLEVVGHALAEVLGLPDVDHPAVLVAELVDPRGVGDLPRAGAVAGGVCHVSHPTCGV
ncbi:hypothetical protein SMICM304S_11676 [Streptomyces microflavus]